MMRWLWMGGLAVVGAWLANWALSEQGYVAVQIAGWLIETSVSALVLLLLMAALLTYGVMRLVVKVWRVPQRWREWRERKRLRLPVERMQAGVQALALSEDQTALQVLSSGKDDSQWLRSMLAAQLAHAQGNRVQRDRLLAQALALAPEQFFTIGLLKARWWLTESPQDALVVIDELRVSHPRQRTLKQLRVEALAASEQWSALSEYLPTAKSALSRGRFLALQQRLSLERLTQARDADQLQSAWQALSRAEQRLPAIVQVYVTQAKTFGVEVESWTLLVRAMQHQWTPSLLPLLAQAASAEPYVELKQVQQWQSKHAQEAGVWWLSGVLAQRLGLLAQAEHDFQRSLSLAPSLPVVLALSDLYLTQSKADAARQLLMQQLQGIASNG